MKIRTIFLAMLVVAVLISTGSLTAFAASGVNQIEEVISESSSTELLDSAANNIKDMAIGIRDSLDSQMKNQADMVKTWAQSPLLMDAVVTAGTYEESALENMWGDENLDDDLSPQASSYLKTLVESTLFTEIIVTDSRGYTVAASGATDTFDLSSEEWFQKVKLAPSGYYTGGTSRDASSGIYEMDIIYSMKDPATGDITGLVKAVFDYSRFIDGFINTNSLLVWEIKVVEPDGNIVATSMIEKSKVNNPEMNQAEMAYFKEVIGGKFTGNSHTTEVDENGESVYFGYAVSKDVSQHVVVVSKKAYTVIAPINGYITGMQDNINEKSSDIQRNMWIMGGSVAVVLMMAAFFVIRAKVSNPLAKLTNVSEKLSVGEIDGLELDVHGKDEIGKLGESFEGVLAAFNLLKEQAEEKEKKEIREPVLR
jgi:nitrogen fixation/metabolism regulation signal transduction histidine kinase